MIKTNPLYYNPKQFKYIYPNKNIDTNLVNIIEMKGQYWESIVFDIINKWNLNTVIWKNSQDKIWENGKEIQNPDYDETLSKYINNLLLNISRYT